MQIEINDRIRLLMHSLRLEVQNFYDLFIFLRKHNGSL